MFISRTLAMLLLFSPAISFASPISAGGEKLQHVLESLNVTERWLPGNYVNWQTGEPISKARGEARKSHCSAFTAAAAAKLGVYILSPPAHKEVLLANAQYFWLQQQGKEHGWLPLKDGIIAQQTANQGCLVVVARANAKTHKPGHIAIVRPSDKSTTLIGIEGPQIIQAGTLQLLLHCDDNRLSTSSRRFKRNYILCARYGFLPYRYETFALAFTLTNS